MLEKLLFVRINKESESRYDSLCELVIPYMRELDSHYPDVEPAPEEAIRNYTKSMVNNQGSADRYLEICTLDGEPIGFYHAKVDHAEHKGYIKPGYGYVMEFYIVPRHRRKGFGALMFQRLCSLLATHGVRQIYLTTDPVSGKPFWERLGFVYKGEISPDNEQEIYEVAINGTQ